MRALKRPANRHVASGFPLSRARLAAAVAIAAGCGATLPHAHADTWTWNGGGASVGNFNWSDAANWTHTAGSSSSGTPLSSTDTVISFAGSLGPVPNQDIANPLLLNSLNFQSGASAFQFSGNALDFATSSASVAPTIVQNSANGTVIINNITLNNNTTLSGSGTGGLIFLGTITGGGALTVTSGGNMTLLGNNNYSGGTTINGGTVVINSSTSLGTGNLTFTSGTLVSGNVTLTTNFTTNGVSAINFQALANTTMVVNPAHALFGSMNFGSAANTGTVNFVPGNFNSFGGTINVNGGTLLDGADALSQILTVYTVNIASGATFNINSFSTTINNLTGSGNFVTGNDASQSFTLTSANFSGIISGASALKTTGNTVLLSGPNTYTGGSVFNGGTVGAGNNSALGTNAVAVTGNTSLFAAATNLTLANQIVLASAKILTVINNPAGIQNLTLSGNISGAGGITMSGSGSLKLSGNNSYSGNTTLNSGELIINNNNSLGNSTLNLIGGIVTASADATINGTYTDNSATSPITFRAVAATTLTLGGTMQFGPQTLNFGSAGFTGTVIFSPGSDEGTNSTFNVNAGTLLDGNGALTDFLPSVSLTVASGAKLDLNGNTATIQNLLGAGNVATGTSAAEHLTLLTANFSGNISGSGQLLTASNSTTVILSGANTYTGPTTFAGGTLGFGNNSALSTGNISLTANTSLYAAAADHTLANNISLASTKALTIQNDPTGAHNLTLSGNITGAGSLVMNGTGALTLSGNNTYTGGTTLNSGELRISGNNSLGNGTLTLNGGTVTAVSNASLNMHYTDDSSTSPITFQAVAGTTLTLGGSADLESTTTLNFGSASDTGTVNFTNGSEAISFFTPININGGTLFNGDGQLLALLGVDVVTIAQSAILDLNNSSTTVGNLLGAGTLKTGTSAGETFTLSAANFSGTITGAGQLVTNGGTAILSGPNTFSGGSNFAGGSIGAGNDSALSTGPITVTANTTLFAASANHTLPNAIAINANQTLTIQDDPTAAHNLTLTSPVSGNGTLAMTGNGTLTLNASLTVNKLIIGTASSPSKVVLGSGPITNKIASLTLNSTSQLDIANDKLIVQDTSFSRPADITKLQNEIASSSINSSVVALINALAGRNEVAVALADDSVLQLTTFGGLPVDLNSILIAPELLGDANFDGHVDLTDLSTVLNNFGTTTPAWTSGNFDHAPTIDLTDLSAVLNNFGLSNPNASTSVLSTQSSALSPIPSPEPTSATLLLPVALLIKNRRRPA